MLGFLSYNQEVSLLGWGGGGDVPKGLLALIFYAMRSLVPVGHFQNIIYIQALIHLACLRVFSVMPWVIVYQWYRVR